MTRRELIEIPRLFIRFPPDVAGALAYGLASMRIPEP